MYDGRRRRDLPGADGRPHTDLRQPAGRAAGGRLHHQPGSGAATTSTAASFPQRNYTLATPWNRLIEVQGFGQRFVNAGGATLGTVGIRASAVTRYITFTVPKAALGGTPGSGLDVRAWCSPVRTASSPTRRAASRPPPQDFQFGVCTAAAVGGREPDLRGRPGDRAEGRGHPHARTGVSQAEELNPLAPPVVIQGITIP